MLTRQDAPLHPAFPGRRAYAALAILASLFAIYVSVIPFEFRFVPWDEAWRTFRSRVLTLAMPPVSRANFLGNILLFVPLGFFAMGARFVDARPRPGHAGAIAGVLAWAAAVSLAAEFLQVFEPSRIPTVADVWAQALGTVIGIAGWLLLGPELTAWLRSASSRSRTDRLAQVLGAYVVAWVFVQLAPFDFVVDPGLIARRLRALLTEPASWGVPGAGDGRAIWNAAATILTAVPIGAAGLIAGTAPHQRRSVPAAFVGGCALVASVEAVQFLVRSHEPSLDHLLPGLLGIALGVFGSAGSLARTRSLPAQQTRMAAPVILALWTAFLAAYHWQPYDFAFDTDVVRRKLEAMPLVPLAGYIGGSELNALNDVLTNISLSMPLGAVAGWGVLGRFPGRLAYALWLIVAGGLFAVIEAGQLFLPSRFPDLSDVLIGVAGSSLGVWIGRWMTIDPAAKTAN